MGKWESAFAQKKCMHVDCSIFNPNILESFLSHITLTFSSLFWLSTSCFFPPLFWLSLSSWIYFIFTNILLASFLHYFHFHFHPASFLYYFLWRWLVTCDYLCRWWCGQRDNAFWCQMTARRHDKVFPASKCGNCWGIHVKRAHFEHFYVYPKNYK